MRPGSERAVRGAKRWLIASSVVGAMLWGPAPLQGGVAETKHNLSASGPGAVKTTETTEVCIFCHTPHRANASRALWNRELPPKTYDLYASSTMGTTTFQPTGASRLCLSCHDGTTAMGTLRTNPEGGPVPLGPMTGAAALGMDLADDHPVSFLYTTNLATAQGELADPATLPPGVITAGKLQCTSCHDPHESRYRKFLRKNDRAGALCVTCHQIPSWNYGTHATSTAAWKGTGTYPWPGSPYRTVRDNACGNCHQPHSAAQPVRLLRGTTEAATCLACHAGSVASKNLSTEWLKASAHPVTATEALHDPTETPATMSRHVACADCHDAHRLSRVTRPAPLISGPVYGARGVSLAGSVRERAVYDYEICLTCHGLAEPPGAGVVRQDNTRNVRLEINPSNPSYHPVAGVGRHQTITGLQGYSATSILRCRDCHNNDARSSGGPAGPHGSRFAPILELNYVQDDPAVESAGAYALCYRCHSRATLLGSGRFPHGEHVRDAQASCAVCHDAHGSRQNIRLINFMLRDRTGRVVVGPNRNGLIQFTPTALGQGACSLTCHGVEHDQTRY